MSKNYVQPGNTLTFVAPSGGVTSGEGYLHGDLVVVAQETALVGENYEGMVVGVHEMTKLSGDNMATVGARIHWDNTNKRWTTTAGTGTRTAGTVAKVAGAGVTTVQVRLMGIGVAANP